MSTGMTYRPPLDNPVVTQEFGARPEYYAQFGQKGHNGLDYRATAGTSVFASEDGVVFYEGRGVNIQWMGEVAGIVIILDHGSVYTGYAHLKSTLVSKGQRVNKGQLIGYSGATGTAQGAHLHFEFIGKPVNIKNGYYGRVDPNPYLEKEDTVKPSSDQVKAMFTEFSDNTPSDEQVRYYTQNDIRVLQHDLMYNEVIPSKEEIYQAFESILGTQPTDEQVRHYMHHSGVFLYRDLAVAEPSDEYVLLDKPVYVKKEPSE